MIEEYIEEKYGFRVYAIYIAKLKQDLVLPIYDVLNAVEELKQPSKHLVAGKVEVIKEELKYIFLNKVKGN